MKKLEPKHCWRVEATLPQGHPMGNDRWAVNKKAIVACNTADRALVMANEYFGPAARIWSVNHHSGQEVILIDEELAIDDKS